MSALDLEFPDKVQFLFEPHRYKILYGGRSSGKSWSVARYLIIKAITQKTNIMCVREFQSSITESVHKLISDQIDELGLTSYFHVTGREITCKTNGSRFFFYGVRRDPAKIKSTEGVDVCWVEEGENCTETSWQILVPTIRKPNSEIIVTFNPKESSDPTYQRFVLNTPPDCKSVLINYMDNPWTSQVMIDLAEQQREEDLDLYQHIWEGSTLERSEAQVLWDKIKVMEVKPKTNWNGPYHAVDFGFSGDPMAAVRCWVFDNDLYIERESSGMRIDNDDLVPHLLNDIPSLHMYEVRCDSSRPETISHIKQRGLPKAIRCTKGADSIKEGIAFLRSFRNIIIDPSCKLAIEEGRFYKYKVDKLSGQILPDIIDKHNNIWDAVRYAVEPLMPSKKDKGGVRVNGNSKPDPRLPR